MVASAFTRAFFPPASSATASWQSSPPRHVFLSTQICRFQLSLLVAPSLHLDRPSIPLAARFMSSTSSSPVDLEELIKSKNSENPVVVYSKTWCPYCLRVKDLFKEVRVKPYVVELDQLADEGEVLAALQRVTGQHTVPNVFIGGMHIGGCDDTLRLHHQKMLVPLLKEANAEFL